MDTPIISPSIVAHIAQLANLDVTTQEQQKFAQAFSETLDEVNKMLAVDVTGVEPTHHTTGAKNVWRQDEVDRERMIPQEAALAQADHVHGSFIVVDRVIEESA